ncbi:MAG: aldehyde dehydrogenase EutE [Verrucomicrobiae bacterium]|nr:aldehyde dehydrogenase EutE [Verrucomicrobiae bacterium]
MSAAPAINEQLIRSLVEDVVARLKQTPGATTLTPHGPSARRASAPNRFGIFADANQACEAAAHAQTQLARAGVEGRRKVEEIVKTLCEKNAEPWGKIELEETKIGRLDHKIVKLQIIKNVPGVDYLFRPAMSGDNGVTIDECTPFGVIGAITPSTHSIPTIACNIISMVAAGNAVVFNTHPSASKCAAVAVRAFNEAIHAVLGIENLACTIEPPTMESFKTLCTNEQIAILFVTGGPGVVKAAMASGKRAICAGPGNPPVVVDETADFDNAARSIITGGGFDNELLCIGEKEIYITPKAWEPFIAAFKRAGAVELNARQIEALTKEAFTFEKGQGAGCPHPVLNKKLVGKDVSVLAQIAGVSAPAGCDLLFGETDPNHPFVEEEQMMPFVPIVRVRDLDEAIREAKRAEHDYRHTAVIHSRNVDAITQMARALNTTIFVANGPSTAGLGSGGEGYLSFSIATPTGEGITTPLTFTRYRRLTMAGSLRIY